MPTVEITHPEKILFPKSKITKQELVDYYTKVAKRMLPLIKDRPISMVRYPEGISKEGFFQKRAAESIPSWIKVASITRTEGQSMDMILCNDLATLKWMANQNCITPHIWLSRVDLPKKPDRMIFDLDPPKREAFKMAIQGAKLLKMLLEKQGLKVFVNTTGSKGLHVVVPIKRELEFAKVREIATSFAQELVETDPKMFTLESRKNARKGRLYIDTIRNSYGATVVAPYGVRALEKAPIAAPISWKELDHANLRSDSFTIHDIQERLKANPWAAFLKSAVSLKAQVSPYLA